MDSNEDIGFLKAKVESLGERVDAHIAWEEKYHDAFEQKLDRIEDTIKEHLTMFRFLKALLYTMILIVSFKFGDIKDIWTNRM